MSLSWNQRKTRLALLLKSGEDEDAEAEALDRLMHGQRVIGKTAKTTEVDDLRFNDKDLRPVGTLEYGQFGVIDVVTCRMNSGVYVRKSIEKRFALRTRDQCSPQFERDLLLAARRTKTPWAPHLLCAFQTSTHLSVVMDYAAGGNLWDVLESSPHGGRILETDLLWWTPQIISAIHWCHLQGFAHRDIKPHNFVLTPSGHIQLIDFGSAAPLLPPGNDGSQTIPKRYCLVPCGTCDYISPEILQAHEAALVALDMSDDVEEAAKSHGEDEEGYGMETDWWSMGAMLYEMAYGVAPFFANDIRQTYVRIINHEKSLKFDKSVSLSHEYQHFIRRLLTRAEIRLGRHNVMEITDHPLFTNVDWARLATQPAPTDLHLPQFVYNDPKPSTDDEDPHPQEDDSISQGFAFSVFFQQSSYTASGGVSVLRPSPGPATRSVTGEAFLPASLLSNSVGNTSDTSGSFIGFSWGPPLDAFPDSATGSRSNDASLEDVEQLLNKTVAGGSVPRAQNFTPRPLNRTPMPPGAQQHETPLPQHTRALSVPTTANWGRTPLRGIFSHMDGTQTVGRHPPAHAYMTPMKPYALSPSAFGTLQRTGGTVRRTAGKRPVSDREAMKLLVDCVGMSARKKVLESGRKPRILEVFSVKRKSGVGIGNVSWGSLPGGGGETDGDGAAGRGQKPGTGSGPGMTSRKELRFDRFTTPIPGPDYSAASSSARSRSQTAGGGLLFDDNSSIYYHPSRELAAPPGSIRGTAFGASAGTDTETETSDSEFGGEGPPPSPSPSPRPGSAMSMMSMTMMSRRSGSQTPTVSGYFGSFNSGSARMRSRSGSGSALVGTPVDRSNINSTTTGLGLLGVPRAEGMTSSRVPPSVSGSHVQNATTGPTTGRLVIPPLATRPPVVRQLNARRAPEASSRSPSPSPTPTPSQSPVPQQRDTYPYLQPQVWSPTSPTHSRSKSDTSPRIVSGSSSASRRDTRRATDISLLEDLEYRHGLLMRDIVDLEDRFDDVASSFMD